MKERFDESLEIVIVVEVEILRLVPVLPYKSDNQTLKDEFHFLQNLNQTKYAEVELNSDHAEQCIYTNDFIESQINGDDFDEWYSDVYPFCTGKSLRPFDGPATGTVN